MHLRFLSYTLLTTVASRLVVAFSHVLSKKSSVNIFYYFLDVWDEGHLELLSTLNFCWNIDVTITHFIQSRLYKDTRWATTFSGKRGLPRPGLLGCMVFIASKMKLKCYLNREFGRIPKPFALASFSLFIPFLTIELLLPRVPLSCIINKRCNMYVCIY